ncbi:MAG: DUF4382 domain-containing protein [Dehalococcoidales bacterium]
MRRAVKSLATLVTALLLVFTAACIPAPAEITPAPAPAPEPTPAPETTPAPAPMPTVNWGTLEIRVTDPPPADVDSAIVYLTNIEVHQVSDNAGWIPIIGAPPSFDLMDVIGVEQVLGSANVTAGSFTQIRMDVDRVEVVTTAGDNITAEVPSGKLRIVRPFNVGAGTITVLTLDFDGEKSLILPGKDIATGRERALFKPVVRLKVGHSSPPSDGGELSIEYEEEEVEVEGEIEEEGEEEGEEIETEAPEALEITITSLPNGQVGENYTATLEATGGTEPYTWSISDGSLPDGLTLDSDTGVISGTPTTEGDYEFTVRVEDSSDPVLSDTEEFSIHIEISP